MITSPSRCARRICESHLNAGGVDPDPGLFDSSSGQAFCLLVMSARSEYFATVGLGWYRHLKRSTRSLALAGPLIEIEGTPRRRRLGSTFRTRGLSQGNH